jgi:hypothetical protein
MEDVFEQRLRDLIVDLLSASDLLHPLDAELSNRLLVHINLVDSILITHQMMIEQEIE